MELWIRSQNGKALMKCTMLNLDNDETGIFVYNDDNYMIMAGKYESKDRALQILNEIQNILQPKVFFHEPKIDYDDLIGSYSENVVIRANQQVEYDLKNAGQIVYVMPQE